MPECKVLNSSMGPSHTVWVPEFTVLALQPRRGIQWKTSQVFQLRQSRGCCYAGRTALCFRCCSAAICRAWLGCTFPILLIPPGTQQSQPRAKASLDPRHMPKDADSHTMCSWPTVVTGMLLTWHARGVVFKNTSTQQKSESLRSARFYVALGQNTKTFCVPHPTATAKASCGAKNSCQLGLHITNLQDSLPLKIRRLCYLGKVESFYLH